MRISDWSSDVCSSDLSAPSASPSPESPVPSPGFTQSRVPSSGSKQVVLAFSGGLDTSFCVPYLQEQGWEVHTVFADTGGVDAAERAFIEQRAGELGVGSHVTEIGRAHV